MRVHKKSIMSLPQNEILCYPITNVTKPLDLFGSYSSQSRSFIPISPPPPPNRKSSKRNTILQMVTSTGETCHVESSKTHRQRHASCYASQESAIVRRSNTSESLRSKSAGPIINISSSRSSLKEDKNLENSTRIARRQFLRVSSASPINRSRMIEGRKSSPSPVAFGRGISKERTFAEEKKRLEEKHQDLTASTLILRDPALKSPDQVKQALHSNYKMTLRDRNACIRASSRRLATSSTQLPGKKSEKHVKVQSSSVHASTSKIKPLTAKFAETIRTNYGRISKSMEKSKGGIKTCSNLSLARTSSTYSIDSTNSKKKFIPSKPLTISRSNSRNVISPPTISSKSRKKKVVTPVISTKPELKKKDPKRMKETKIETHQAVLVQRSANKSASREQKSEIIAEKEIVESINEAIINQKDGNTTRGDNFFQQLFLRNIPSPTPSTASSYYRNTSVLEKARMWDSIPYKSESSLPQQNIYLTTKCPVSSSKFKIVDDEQRYLSRMSRSLSPNRIFRSNRQIISKFDSLYQLSSEEEEDEFGNVSRSLTYSYHERSRSEPPSKTLTVFTEIQRPDSPLVITGRSQSPPRSIRSPSCRRIQSLKSNSPDVQHIKRVNRARSLGSADRSTSRHNLSVSNDLARSTCSLNLERHNPNCSHRRSDRFKELNEFYSTVERVGQLERATSISDVRPIRMDEDVVDYDLWRKIRNHEKNERELNYLVKHLKEEQKEKDVLFRPHDPEEIRWNSDKDSGLRIKEKSVEDLREVFHRKQDDIDFGDGVRNDSDVEKGKYKLLYRGSSVLDLASNMVEKYNPPERSDTYRPIKSKTKDSKLEERKLGLSTKLMSTLSKDQISKIKHQLSEIYSNGPLPGQKSAEKYEEISEKYIVTVPPPPESYIGESSKRPILTVRSNSLLTREELLNPVLQKHATRIFEKSESISTLNEPTSSGSSTLPRRKERSDSSQLSEDEKRKLSESLSREIKDKLSQKRELLPKETRGAYAAQNANLTKSPEPPRIRSQSEESHRSVTKTPETITVNRRNQTKKIQLRPISACESLTSSEHSNQTVIFKQKQQQINDTFQEKIKYFEEKKQDESHATTIYHAREDSSPDEEEVMKVIEAKRKLKEQHERSKSPGLTQAQSVTDLKEMFGEKIYSNYSSSLDRKYTNSSNQSHSLPPSTEIRHSGEIIIHESNPLSNTSSFESVYRSRSASPRHEVTFQKSYLNLAKTGDVQKIRNKFESLDVSTSAYWKDDQSPRLSRRYRSDPEIDNNFFEKRGTSPNKVTVRDHEAGDVSRITHKFELRNSASRGRSRTRRERVTSPIPKVPLKKDDRFMPHIDIISKTASLKQEIRPPSGGSWPNRQTSTIGIEKMKSKYESQEKMSILGQMYTSTPDFRELKDISSYLNGSWVAHQYPKPEDNSLSTSSHPPVAPAKSPRSRTPISRKPIIRPSSTSPPRNKSVTSILKPYYDIFADQPFDPVKHRPKYRYVPGKQLEAEQLWKKLQASEKLSVKFEGLCILFD